MKRPGLAYKAKNQWYFKQTLLQFLNVQLAHESILKKSCIQSSNENCYIHVALLFNTPIVYSEKKFGKNAHNDDDMKFRWYKADLWAISIWIA